MLTGCLGTWVRVKLHSDPQMIAKQHLLRPTIKPQIAIVTDEFRELHCVAY